MRTITDLPLEMLNYLCTYLNWVDVVVLELVIPDLKVEQSGIHYDFKLKELKKSIKVFRSLKKKQHRYHQRFKSYPIHSSYLQSSMKNFISITRKQMYHLHLIKKVEEDMQVKFLKCENVDIFCPHCETKFCNVDALETHSKIIYSKCFVPTIDDLFAMLMN